VSTGGDVKVFASGMPWATTEEEIREFFGKCGNVAEVREQACRIGFFRGDRAEDAQQ
jgi:RNA recognition motif-containing protein